MIQTIIYFVSLIKTHITKMTALGRILPLEVTYGARK